MWQYSNFMIHCMESWHACSGYNIRAGIGGKFDRCSAPKPFFIFEQFVNESANDEFINIMMDCYDIPMEYTRFNGIAQKRINAYYMAKYGMW